MLPKVIILFLISNFGYIYSYDKLLIINIVRKKILIKTKLKIFKSNDWKNSYF